ncbi:aldo/keto reductase, partial [Candidatus Poribacteria bacterium]|nr:aldo/keto reductase [Candidatus Poribacteria bacterium]
MEYRPLGRTGLEVSTMSVGAAAMGGEFGDRRETESIETAHRAIDMGVNYFDTSPYYGRTRSEQVLGKALIGKRDKVVLSTKTGRFDSDEFDFTESRLRNEVDNSLRRLHTDHVDILIAHDVEFADPAVVIGEGLPTLAALKAEGKTRFIGVSGLPLHVMQTAIGAGELDLVLSYCRYCLNDTALAPYAREWRQAGLGVINASPLSMALLTPNGPPDWHPASDALADAARRAAAHCRDRGADLAFLGMQYAFACPDVDT